jgi:site-specific recombinase XerC
VTDFVWYQVHKLSPGRAQLLVTALRSFLRYLRHQGTITTDLNACVPTVARWSFATLPKFLPAGTVQRVLDRNDRPTSIGRRDYAILLLLARLGLRACEIVALNLDDIDWDNARITIRSKGGRWAQLPLPTDVGEENLGTLARCWPARLQFIEPIRVQRQIGLDPVLQLL